MYVCHVYTHTYTHVYKHMPVQAHTKLKQVSPITLKISYVVLTFFYSIEKTSYLFLTKATSLKGIILTL